MLQTKQTNNKIRTFFMDETEKCFGQHKSIVVATSHVAVCYGETIKSPSGLEFVTRGQCSLCNNLFSKCFSLSFSQIARVCTLFQVKNHLKWGLFRILAFPSLFCDAILQNDHQEQGESRSIRCLNWSEGLKLIRSIPEWKKTKQILSYWIS